MRAVGWCSIALALIAGCSDGSGRSPTAPNFNEHAGAGPQLGTPQFAGVTWYAKNNNPKLAIDSLRAVEKNAPPSIVAIIERQVSDIQNAQALVQGTSLLVLPEMGGRVFYDAKGNVTQGELTNHIVIQ